MAASWFIWKYLYPQSLNTAERAGEISNTNLKIYSCLSYWWGSVSVLPELKYLNLANITWNACRRKGYFRMGYTRKLRFAVYPKHRRWKDGWLNVCFCRGFPQGNIRFGNWHHLHWRQGHARYFVQVYLEHGRIELRICRIYRGEELIVDGGKWNGSLIEILTSTEKKSDGRSTSEQWLQLTNRKLDAKMPSCPHFYSNLFIMRCLLVVVASVSVRALLSLMDT